MGLDFHGLSFLKYVAKRGPLGGTVTLGRQEIHVNAAVYDTLVGPEHRDVREAYCEKLLGRVFGASSVESIDNSDFEKATHILDMNRPLPEDLRDRYDTVIDAGTLEHVFNIVQALGNCSALCRPGGQIVHILPSNNFCGHGFWQFSPELFFSLYSPANGYRDTEVFVSEFVDKTRWFRVRKPSGGRRINIMSTGEMSVMVRTTRADGPFSHEEVQQSDYAYEWANNVHDPQPLPPAGGIKGRLMNTPFLYKRLFPLYHRLKRLRSPERLSAANPGLEEMLVADAIA